MTDWWGKVGAIAGVVGAATAVVGVVVAMVIGVMQLGQQPDGARAGAASPSATSPPSETLRDINGREGSAETGSSDDCLSRSGATAACGAIGTGTAVDVVPCTAAEVLEAWGAAPDVEQVLLDVVTVGSRCVALPAGPAAGVATGTDVRRLAANDVPASLRSCARRSGSPTTTCNRPHEVEWVGPWTLDRDTTRAQQETACVVRAGRYSNRRTGTFGAELTARLYLGRLEARPAHRCALQSQVPLTGSVRLIGSEPLPAAS